MKKVILLSGAVLGITLGFSVADAYAQRGGHSGGGRSGGGHSGGGHSVGGFGRGTVQSTGQRPGNMNVARPNFGGQGRGNTTLPQRPNGAGSTQRPNGVGSNQRPSGLAGNPASRPFNTTVSVGVGRNFRFGVCFDGRHHNHWSSRCWSSRWGCWCYYEPTICRYYYWCEQDQCFYPLGYCPYGSYVSSDGVVVEEIPVVDP